jgi:hypothetical protein
LVSTGTGASEGPDVVNSFNDTASPVFYSAIPSSILMRLVE